MAAFEGLDTIWCYTRDMGASVAFYRDVLGLKPVVESPYWSSFDLGGVKLGLHPADGAVALRPSGWILGFLTDDLPSLRQKLVAAGIEVAPEYHEIPGGVILEFRDPNGCVLQATQRGVTLAQVTG